MFSLLMLLKVLGRAPAHPKMPAFGFHGLGECQNQACLICFVQHICTPDPAALSSR